MADTLLSEKKSSIKDIEKGADKLADKLLSEKKYSTKKDEKGIDKLSDTLSLKNKSLTNKLEKGTDELADMILSDKKSSKKHVEKGTDELALKKNVNAIRRKGLNQFEVQSTGTKEWFKLDIDFLRATFSKSHSEFYKKMFKKNIED